jgi:hypothetical protein
MSKRGIWIALSALGMSLLLAPIVLVYAGPRAPALSRSEPAASPAPAIIAQPQQPAAASRDSSLAPTIRLSPEAGAAGDRVTVEGSGFPAGQNIGIYIGLPNAGYGPQTYAEATADAEGRLTATFVMPATWPDGEPIRAARLIVIAGTPDGSLKAMTPFAYR